MLKIAIAAGIVFAAWLGGATFAQIFSLEYAGIALTLFVVTLVLVRVFIWANFGIISWFIFCLMLFAAYGVGTVFKYNVSDMATYKMGADAPVGFKLVQRYGVNTGTVVITNLSPDMMVSAKLKCSIYYDNGARIERDFYAGVAGPAQFAPGASKETMAVNSSVWLEYRTNPNDMTCEVYSAEFVRLNAVLSDLAVKWAFNAQDYKTDFYVTNNSLVPVKNVQFNCVNQKGESMKVVAYPSYLKDLTKETIISVNETVKFTSRELHFKYTNCVVSNAIAL